MNTSVAVCKLCKKQNRLSLNNLFVIKNAPSGAQYFLNNSSQKKKVSKLIFFQCEYCNFCQLANKPVPYWKTVISAVGFSKQLMSFRRKQIKSFLKKNKILNKKIIEIGSGAGQHIQALVDGKINAFGLEFGNYDYNKKIKKRIFKGFIFDKKIKNSPYSSFFCFNFLEHFPDPVSALLSIKKILTKPGYGLIEVPNLEFDLKKKENFNLVRDHVSYFTPKTLSIAIGLAGFEIIKLYLNKTKSSIFVEIKTKSEKVIDSFLNNKKIYNIGKFFIKNKKLVIWGASHQTFTILSMLKPKNIIAIVDSAKFKQNKFDPSLGIKIVPPNKLHDINPEAIFISAASFEKEIREILKKKFNYQGKIESIKTLSNKIF